MPVVQNSETHQNLLAAFAEKSQAIQRYLWFAEQADVEGHPEVAAVFRLVAGHETGHAQGLLEFLAEVGDPLTGGAIGDSRDNLQSALGGGTTVAVSSYPAYAAAARKAGRDDVAEWFDSLAQSEERSLDRLRAAANTLGD